MNDEELGRLRAYLDDELDDAHRDDVEDWIASSSSVKAALDELRELDEATSALLGVEPSPPRTAAAWRELEKRDRTPAPRSPWLPVGVVVALAATLLFAVFWPWGGREDRGSLEADRRQSVEIGDRAVAVAEPAASLSWVVESDGRSRVRQSSGAVFYRVDAGDDFVVETPAGSVTVTGTCFTVELSDMNTKSKHIASATAGAAVAAAITLTVHEGSVVLANERGDVEVVAGERADARPGRTPRLSDDESSPVQATAASPFDALARENREQRQQLRELQTKLAQLSSKETNAEPTPQVDRESPEYLRAAGRACGENGNCDFELWTDPSPEGLAELAKCGRVLVDTPSFMGGDDVLPPGRVIEAAGLSEEETLRYAEVAEQFKVDTGEELTVLAEELGLSAALVERVSPVQLRGIVRALPDSGMRAEMRRRIANERAGLTEPPSSETPGERALRYLWDMGDGFEQRLAEAFGPEVAHEMRRASGGWRHKSSLGDGLCNE